MLLLMNIVLINDKGRSIGRPYTPGDGYSTYKHYTAVMAGNKRREKRIGIIKWHNKYSRYSHAEEQPI